MDADLYARLREEVETLMRLRNESAERVEAGDEAAVPWLRAVGDLIIDRDEELSALWPDR